MDILKVFVTLYFLSVEGIFSQSQVTEVPNNWPLEIVCSTPIIVLGPTCCNDNQSFQCTIRRFNDVIFNETILFNETSNKGYFSHADLSWNNSIIQISLTNTNNSNVSASVNLIIVVTPTPYQCSRNNSNHKPDKLQEGDRTTVYCTVNTPLTEQTYNAVTVDWYKDCQLIERSRPEYEYMPQAFSPLDPIQQFDSLLIKNAQLNWTAGNYQCLLSYNGITVKGSEKNLCVKRKGEFKYKNQPSAIASRTEVVVEPGSRAALECTGVTATKPSRQMPVMYWTQEGQNGSSRMICDLRLEKTHFSDDNVDCFFNFTMNECYEHPLTAEEIIEENKIELNDNYVTTFIIRNVSYQDAGNYICTLETTRPDEMAEIELIVRARDQTHNVLTIVLIVVGVLLLIGLIILLLVHIFWIDVNYFLKKCCGKYGAYGRDTFAYLVYYPDPSDSKLGQILDDCEWCFRHMNHTWCDDNKAENPETSNAGVPVADNMMQRMKTCDCVTVIVTEALLSNNGMELLSAYQGMDHAVRESLPLIFITTKKLKSQIRAEAKRNSENKSFVAFHRALQIYPLILWEEGRHTKFYRAIYVAGPKRRPQQFNNPIYNENAR